MIKIVIYNDVIYIMIKIVYSHCVVSLPWVCEYSLKLLEQLLRSDSSHCKFPLTIMTRHYFTIERIVALFA